LRVTPTKTETTTEARVAMDLLACPMVTEELERISRRTGPLIIDDRNGLPYRPSNFLNGWRKDRKAAGLSAALWNRDLRAGGNTEGQQAGAPRDDRRKVMGHSTDRMTADVYDRDVLQSHRRIAEARVKYRLNKPETT
jgi:integrase